MEFHNCRLMHLSIYKKRISLVTHRFSSWTECCRLAARPEREREKQKKNIWEDYILRTFLHIIIRAQPTDKNISNCDLKLRPVVGNQFNLRANRRKGKKCLDGIFHVTCKSGSWFHLDDCSRNWKNHESKHNMFSIFLHPDSSSPIRHHPPTVFPRLLCLPVAFCSPFAVHS